MYSKTELSKVGRPSLVDDEVSIKKTITFPSGLLKKALERTEKKHFDNLAAYIRYLIQKDLKSE